MKKGMISLLVLAASFAGCAGMGKTPAPPPPADMASAPNMRLDDPAVMFGKPLGPKTMAVQAFSYVSKRHKHKKKAAPAPSPTGAWGDKLDASPKCIAVSPDLVDMGLTRNTKVTIDGLDGEYLVLDTMSKRWTKSIDIYQGNDHAAALQWGTRDVRISWVCPGPESPRSFWSQAAGDETEH